MTDVYDLHQKAFARVAAFAILRDGRLIGKVAFKYPADGAGRLYAYVHILGSTMTRGFAGGYGYDKHSPAVRAAVDRIEHNGPNVEPETRDLIESIRAALHSSDGRYWHDLLRAAGLAVEQVV